MDDKLLKTGGITTPATSLSFDTNKGSSFFVNPFNQQAPSQTGTTPAPKPSQAGFTPSGLFINDNGTINIEKSLAEAKRKADEIQKGVQSLVSQQKPATDIKGVVSSSEPVVNEEKNIQDEIKKISIPSTAEETAKAASEAYLKTLEEQAKALEQRRKDEIASIESSFATTKAKTEEEQKREVGTTNVALQRVGGYLGTQISAVGVLNNLASTHRSEISALEAKKATAIQEAKNAIDDKQFKIAQLKAQEAKDIDKEINDRRNKFFDQSMQVVREQRQKEIEERTAKQAEFKTSLDKIDRIAPTIIESIQGMDETNARNFILGAAKDLKIDPNLLIGTVNELNSTRRENERKEVVTLAQKYPSAGIDPTTDDFNSASDKIRNSKEYKLDIVKAETDLANTKSLISQRSSDQAIDYSDPVLKIYTQSTGEIIGSPSKARAVLGYANALLSDKEIVSNDFQGTLLDNQIRESDAKKMIQEAFVSLPKEKGFGTFDDSAVWQWLSTEEAQGYSDEQKKTFIMQAGKNPDDFGIY